MEIGPRDMKQNQVVVVRRDNGEKQTMKKDSLSKNVLNVLENIQSNLYAR